MPFTRTFTKTYSRISLLRNNLRAALASYGWPKYLIHALVDVGLADENRFIKAFHSYGMVPDTDTWELHSWVAVDWDEHGRLLVNAETVTVDDRWVNGINPGLIEMAEGFASLVSEIGLERKFVWTYSDTCSLDDGKIDAAVNTMGLAGKVVSAKVEPAGIVEDTQSNRLAGLGELSFGSESAFRE